MISPSVVVLFIIGLVVLPVSVKGAVPVVGGGGYGLYLDATKADVVGMDWVNMTGMVDSGTFELWYKTGDAHMEMMPLLSYATLEADGSSVVMTEGAFQARLMYNGLDFEKGSKSKCRDEDCMGLIGGVWTHFAITWDLTGTYQVYVNGELKISKTVDREIWKTPIVQHGCAVFGQDQDSYCGGFNEMQAFTGQIDELRIWNEVRSADDIAKYMNLSFVALPEGERSKLNMYYSFDSVGSDVVPDLSGLGNVGLVGKLPGNKQVMEYVTLTRGQMEATKPRYVKSQAPVIGSGAEIIAFTPNGTADLTVELLAFDEDGDSLTMTVSTLPTKGTLHLVADSNGSPLALHDEIIDSSSMQTKRVIYRPTTLTAGDVDGFSFAISDDGGNTISVEGNVVVYSGETLDQFTPQDMNISVAEDAVHVFSLGTVGYDGATLIVEILTIPDAGGIYEPYWDPALAYKLYSTVDLRSENEIVNPSIVSNARGVVLFQGPPDTSGSTSFTYRFKHPNTGAVSESATIYIEVTAENDAPFSNDMNVSVQSNMATEIILNATDIDGPPGRQYVRIVDFPSRGKLYQVDDGTGTTLIDGSLETPFVGVWVRTAVNASSQYDYCDHTEPWLPRPNPSCNVHSYNIEQVEGEPDLYPSYGDVILNWSPANPNSPFEFIEVEMEMPLFLSQVSVYETSAPGSITAIMASETYEGHETNWTTLYEGETLKRKDTDIIFAPPICPLNMKSQYVRVELKPGQVSGWNEFDAIGFKGTLTLQKGQVIDDNNRVSYKPTPGVHPVDVDTVFDSFTYTSSDCIGTSEPIQVDIRFQAIPLTTDVDSLTIFGKPIVATAPAGGTEEQQAINVSLHKALDSIDGTVTKILVFSNPDADAANDSTSQIGDTSDGLRPLKDNKQGWVADNTMDRLFLFAGTHETDQAIHVWVTVNDNLVYRLRVQLAVECPAQFIKLSTETPCQSCESISEDIILGFSSEEKGLYTQQCDRVFVRSQQLRNVVFGLAAVGLVFLLTLGLTTLRFRSNWIMKVSSWKFLVIMFIASSGLFVYVYLNALDPTDTICVLKPWFLHCSFVVIIGCLASKTYRISKIFNNQGLKKVKFTNTAVLKMISQLLAVTAILLSVVTATDPPSKVEERHVEYRLEICASQSGSWSLILFLFDGALLLWQVYLCYKVRNVPTEANESAHIALGIYAIFLVAILLVPVLFITSNPDIKFLLESVAIILCVATLMGALIVPKLIMIWNGVSNSSSSKHRGSPIGSVTVAPTTTQM